MSERKQDLGPARVLINGQLDEASRVVISRRPERPRPRTVYRLVNGRVRKLQLPREG